MGEFVAIRSALVPEDFVSLRTAVFESPLIGASPLTGTFESSRGFAVSFRRDGLQTLCERFPQLALFTQLALAPRPANALRRWPGRWLRHDTHPNAFYLNLLLVPPGGEVGPHIDATLRGHCDDPHVVPKLVSVLYLQVPNGMTGGELILSRRSRIIARLRPETGTLLHFRGDLCHAVSSVTVPGPQAKGFREDLQGVRASLVCEQYALSPLAYAAMTPFKVHSKAAFAAYLSEQQTRPPKHFVLD